MDSKARPEVSQQHEQHEQIRKPNPTKNRKHKRFGHVAKPDPKAEELITAITTFWRE